MKNVLFIEVTDPTKEAESRYPGLGLAYLVSALKARFGENYYRFKIIENGGVEEFQKQLFEFQPDIVGISAVTKNFGEAIKCMIVAKKQGIAVIAGGVHISMLPQSLPKEADVACLGEGERTILELFELFNEKRFFLKDDFKNIRGIAYRNDNNEVVLTAPQALIENLDEIVVPARDLLKIDKHSYIFSSRGCPYRCAFCASSRFWDKVRLFSAHYVVDEIKELYFKYGADMISFFDDLFIVSPQRLEEITDLLKKEGLAGKIRFTCSCRSNLVNEKIAKLLKEMGVVSVGLGLDSGNVRVLKYLKGDTTSVDHNKKAVEYLKNQGIAVNASFIIGSPDETKEEMMDTYNFIKNSRLDLVDIYVLTPFPGTPIWEYAKQRKLVSEDMDWSLLTSNFDTDYRKAIIVSEIYNRNELFQIYKKFRRLRLYKNIKNIWHSPFLADLPNFVSKIIKQKITSFYGR